MSFRYIFIVGLFLFFLIGPTRVNAQASVKEAEQLDFAQGLLSRGMYDMAILQCQKFIADYPHSTFLQEAHLSLGEAYYLSQDFKKAVDTFNQFKQLYPHSEQLPVSLLRLGQIDIQQKKYNEAIKELTSIDAQKQLKGPMLQSFDFYTAQAYMGKADTAAALEYFQKATQVKGASSYTAYAFKEMGKIDAQNGHYSESMDEYAKSMQAAADDSLKGELTYRIAEVEFLSGKYADAIKKFEEVLDQYPGLGFTQDALANLLFTAALAFIELKEYSKANALLDRVFAFPALKPQERAKIFIKKADILIREGKYRDGLALLDAHAFEKINDADETFLLIKAYIWVCNEYLKEQKFNKVLHIAVQAEKHFPVQDLLEIKYFKAEALRALGRCDEAVKNYDLVTSSTPKNAYTGSAHIGYGLCLAASKKFDDARKEFEKSLDENADDYTVTVHARFEMANLEASQGNFDDALKFYLLVATIYDDGYLCSESLLRAAKIDEHLQRKADALKMYLEILDKYKNSTAARYAKKRVRLLK